MHDWLSRAVQRAYHSPIGDAAVAMGLRSGLKDLYAVVLYYTSNAEERVSVGSTEAVYSIDSPRTAFEVHQNIDNECPIIADFIEHAASDDVFYDVGAGIGTYTCLVGQSVAQSVAFEPDIARYDLLRTNSDRNRIRGEALNVALGEVTGARETNEYVDSDVVNGDELRREEGLPPPDLVKIDVDGPELHVLRGLEGTLSAGPRLVWIEVHPNRLDSRGHSLDALQGFLRELGFTVEERSLTGLKSPYLRASR